jgi:hypothetical protein
VAQQGATLIMSHLGLEYVPPRMVATSRYFSFNVNADANAYDVSGFDLAYAFQHTSPQQFSVDSRDYMFRYDEAGAVFKLSTGGLVVISLPVQPMFERVTAYRIDNPNSAYSLPQEILSVDVENQFVRARLYFRSMSGTEDDDGHNVTGVGGTLYLDFKQPL